MISFLLLGFLLSSFSSLSSISIYGLEVLLSVRKIAKATTATTTSEAAACLRSAVVVPRSALGVVINHSLSTTSHIVYLGSSVCFLCSCFFSSSLYFASSLSLLCFWQKVCPCTGPGCNGIKKYATTAGETSRMAWQRT